MSQNFKGKIPGRTLGEQSREIGAKWHGEPEEVKEKFREQAQLAKERHESLYPGYKYRPKKSAKRAKRNTKGTEPQKRQKVQDELPNQLQTTEPFINQVVDKKETKIIGESQVEAGI